MKTKLLPSFRTAAAAIVLAAAITVPQILLATDNGVKPKKPVKRDLSKGNTLFVVPYAHLDTQWRWAYPQVIREFIASTLHNNFKLIDKYPNYVFNFSGSRRYEMMREYYPDEFVKLKEYIKAGRWFPCGSSVDENDANVPSAESLIRQTLYGNRFFRREFGTASHEYMLPDCFGFPYALPSILVHCGIRGFSTQKLTWGSAVGIPFKVGTWEGPDGKSIVAALDPGSYGGGVSEDLSENTSWLARIENTGKESGAYVDYHYYGTGDRGGAPNPDSVAWVEKSIAGKGPITVVSSHSDEMFNDLTPEEIAKLPHYKGELLLTAHSAGSISSEAYMKRWNRKNELLADAAERASVAAMWLGTASYPSDRLYNAWDLVLGSQMHDMLPGTSIPKAYEFCWNDELLALNQFAAVTQDAVGAVTSTMDTRAQGRPIVVYNPLSIPREDVAVATLPGFGKTQGIQVYGPDGKPVPTQLLSNEGGSAHFLFLAKVPPTGFATFDVRQSSAPAHSAEKLSANGDTIENGRFKVTVNGDGDIASIYDKANGREVLKAPSRLAFQYENPKQFPAWNMDWADQQKPPREYVHGPAKIRVVENGPVRVALSVERETGGSKFVQRISLAAGSAGDRVEVANKIDWQTKETALKATFPLTSGNPEATYDLQLGAIKRANNNEKKYEVPQHQWIDLSKPDDSYGVGILNDGKFASDKPDDDTLRLTLIYTPGVQGGYQDQATQDFGRHDTLYAIAPHSGNWRKGSVAWTAKRLNQPLRTFAVPAHAGEMGKSISFMAVNNQQVEISALKKAEDSDEVIVRLRELSGTNATNVRVGALGGIVSAREVTGQELPLGIARLQDGELVTDVPAFSLRAFAIKLGHEKVKVTQVQSQPVSLDYNAAVSSTVKNPSAGAFNKAGESLSAEQFPSTLTVSGIKFKFGTAADGAKNAIVAEGQTVRLPSGFSKVYLLAASSAGDVPAQFKVGNETANATVQSWTGYIGQWDNRQWAGDVGVNFTNYGEMAGLTPGYVKPGEVAWWCSHIHNPRIGNEFYVYSYLYKYCFDIPQGANSITLPNDPRIHILAVSVAKNGHDSTLCAQPLYDTLSDHKGTAQPTISPSGGTFTTETAVTVKPPLYWREGGLHYTLDGTDPTPSSPVCTGTIILDDSVTLKIAESDSSGRLGPVATASYDIHDTTPPSVISAMSPKALGFVRVQFSKRVNPESAVDPQHYKFSSSAKVVSGTLAEDQHSVELTLDKVLPVGQSETLVVSGVKDLSKGGNTLDSQTVEIAEKGAIFTSPVLEPNKPASFPIQNLPLKAHDSWTINCFCKIDTQPVSHTVIAGFGRPIDGITGTGRYFAIFSQGINFWSANCDVQSTVPFDVGKWQMLSATYDGTTLHLYKNGEQIAEGKVQLADDRGRVQVMPLDAWERKNRFAGEVRDLTVWDQDLSAAAVKRLWEAEQKQ